MRRRDFLLAAALAGVRVWATDRPWPGDVGVNTSSFSRQVRSTAGADGRIDPMDLPRILREEIGVRVIDLVHTTLDSRDPRVLERFRSRAEAAGCTITNLKVNDHNLPFDGADPVSRRHALEEYKRWIDAAALLGVRWLRPYPARQPPRWEDFVAGYRELADYARPRGIVLLAENYLWLERQPEAITRLVQSLPGRVAAAPDTGNWPDEAARHRGLAQLFPHAVTADFKVRELAPDGGHAWYDLREAFSIGHRAGFRGPWCIEHTHPERAVLIRELRGIADRLRIWMADATL